MLNVVTITQDDVDALVSLESDSTFGLPMYSAGRLSSAGFVSKAGQSDAHPDRWMITEKGYHYLLDVRQGRHPDVHA